MSRARTTLEVYNPDTPYSNPPDAVIPYGEGRRRVYCGEAVFVNRGKAIRLRKFSIDTAPKDVRAGSAECNKSRIEKFGLNGPGMSRGAQESNPYENEEVSAGT
jgi:hypothetical protein